jgi:transcriptional regulator with GAF, ATPase, and Fis domain
MALGLSILLRHAPGLESSADEIAASLTQHELRVRIGVGLGKVANSQHESGPQSCVIALIRDIDASGLAWVRACRAWASGRLLVIVDREDAEITLGEGTAILQAGADEVLARGEGAEWAKAASSLLVRWTTIERALDGPSIRARLIGESQTWRSVLRELVEAAIFSQASILITGETGTGKELLAQVIHELDPVRSTRALVVVDCTTLSRELGGSELFGHERGAFTGATTTREGAIAQADGGTLLLDEIGELPMDVQARFLRVLQERTYKRVGGDVWMGSDFRLVCATNRDLEAEVAAGRFRADLYHRIASIVCRSPSLRERAEDVPLLAEHFLREAIGRASSPTLTMAVREFLVSRAYPGNVRELRQLMYSIARRYVGAGPVSLGMIGERERARLACNPPSSVAHDVDWREGEAMRRLIASAMHEETPIRELARAVETAAVSAALERHGTVRAAAAKLGLTERALQLRRAADRRAAVMDADQGTADEHAQA